jgi:hypothetical protein
MSNSKSVKNYAVTLVLVVLLGFLGGHRFYVGKVGTGLLFFFTGGFFLIGWIVDIFTVAFGNFTDKTGSFVRPQGQREVNNDMTDDTSTNDATSKTPKKKVPTWVWIVGGILVFGLILQSCGADSEPPAVEPESDVVVPDLEVDELTEPAAAEPTETEVELTVADIREIVFPLVFDSSRSQVIGILNDLPTVESVDLYAYDAELGLVDLDVTPRFDFDPGVRDDAWEIFRIFSVLYEGPDGNWLSQNPDFAPDLRVKVSLATYQCDANAMIDLADAMLSRSAWETACRVQ